MPCDAKPRHWHGSDACLGYARYCCKNDTQPPAVQGLIGTFTCFTSGEIDRRACSPAAAARPLHGLAPGSQIVAYFASQHSLDKLQAIVHSVLRASLDSNSGATLDTEIVQRSSFAVYCTMLTFVSGLEVATLAAGLVDGGARSVTIMHPDGRVHVCACQPLVQRSKDVACPASDCDTYV